MFKNDLYVNDTNKKKFLEIIEDIQSDMKNFISEDKIKEIIENQINSKINEKFKQFLILGFDDHDYSTKYNLSTTYYNEKDSYLERSLKISLNFFQIEIIQEINKKEESFKINLEFKNKKNTIFAANIKENELLINSSYNENESLIFFEDIKNSNFTENTFTLLSCITDKTYIPENIDVKEIIKEYNVYFKTLFETFKNKKNHNILTNKMT